MIKYVCWGGEVYSSDGDVHYISAHKLPRLYGVPYNQCIFCDHNYPETYLGRDLTDLINLHPRSNGDYILEKR